MPSSCPSDTELTEAEFGGSHLTTSIYWRKNWKEIPESASLTPLRIVQPMLPREPLAPRKLAFELIVDRDGRIAVATALFPLPKELVEPLSVSFQQWRFKPRDTAATTVVSFCYGRIWEFAANNSFKPKPLRGSA